MEILALVAIAGGAWALMSDALGKKTTAMDLPADPAGRREAVRAVIRSQDLAGIQPQLLDTLSTLETGDYKGGPFMRTNSLFNIHKGDNSGDWTGKTAYANPQDVDLRVYDSLEQSVRDVVLHLQGPRYADALAAARAGQPDQFYAALMKGDGQLGWVGDPNTPHAKTYTAQLISNYNSAVV